MASWKGGKPHTREKSGKTVTFAGTNGGWYPAAPEFMNFPRPPSEGGSFVWGKRGGTGRGTQKKKLPAENKGPTQMTDARRLAENARAVGWLNGRYIGKKGAVKQQEAKSA